MTEKQIAIEQSEVQLDAEAEVVARDLTTDEVLAVSGGPQIINDGGAI